MQLRPFASCSRSREPDLSRASEQCSESGIPHPPHRIPHAAMNTNATPTPRTRPKPTFCTLSSFWSGGGDSCCSPTTARLSGQPEGTLVSMLITGDAVTLMSSAADAVLLSGPKPRCNLTSSKSALSGSRAVIQNWSSP
eukprot:1691345-Prymnesium_polylepis.1